MWIDWVEMCGYSEWRRNDGDGQGVQEVCRMNGLVGVKSERVKWSDEAVGSFGRCLHIKMRSGNGKAALRVTHGWVTEVWDVMACGC